MRGFEEYRGYKTRVAFDVEAGRFCNVPLVEARENASPYPVDVQAKFQTVLARVKVAHENHLGYPYNLDFSPGVPAMLGNHLINNLGDPYAGSHYASEVCDLEREAIDWLKSLWRCDDTENYWGSIGASGTEGNLWGIYLGREALHEAVLLHSDEAHYSIPKAARLLRMDARSVSCTANGAIDLDAFTTTLEGLKGSTVIVALTSGTTMKGAHDDIAGVITRLDAAGISKSRRYIHIDGALNAMVLPFVTEAPFRIQPSFKHDIDSISTSGHKMIGTPMPCGALICKRDHVKRVATAIAYLRSNDTTLMGSRNGHAVLAIWSRFFSHGMEGYRLDVQACIKRAHSLSYQLRAFGVPTLLNEYSLTVVFPQPSENIVKTYQLACHQGNAHAIVMPNVTDSLLQKFVEDFKKDWQSLQRAKSIVNSQSLALSAMAQACLTARHTSRAEPKDGHSNPVAPREEGHRSSANGTLS